MSHPAPCKDALTSLAELREGHKRYRTGKSRITPAHIHSQVKASVHCQNPFAVILACADSRVPPEIVFDQAVGDLFVLRVAGNVADAFILGSMQYAIEHLGTRLIVVLGHERCGAVKAALDVAAGRGRFTGPLGQLVSAIVPRVAPIYRGDKLLQNDDPEALLDQAVRVNVRRQVAVIRDALAHLGEEEVTLALWLLHLQVVGARYDLDTGEVEFFDVPDPARRRRVGLIAAGDRPVSVAGERSLLRASQEGLEVFELHEAPEGLALRSRAGGFVRARAGGVAADGESAGEGLALVDLGDGHYALRTPRGAYLCVQRDGKVVARGLGESARFRIIEIDD